MTKRYPCQAVGMLILGILLKKGIMEWQEAKTAGFGLFLSMTAVFGAAVLAGICIRREPLKRKRLRQAAILFLSFLIGMLRLSAVCGKMERSLAGLSDGQKITLQGRVIKKQSKPSKEPEDSWTVYLTDCYLNDLQGIRPCENLILYTDPGAGEPVTGSILMISGTIRFFQEARNDGNFDERSYYQNQGYAFAVYAGKNSCRQMNEDADRLQEVLYRLRQKLVQVYQSAMPQLEAGVLCAMLTGEKSLLAEETKQLYRQSGIAHILAISGLHISILGMAVFRLLRRLEISYLLSSIVSMSMLSLFAMMTGSGISTMRAVIMFALCLGAACCGRAYDSMTGLSVAAALLLLDNPRCLFLAGFQFSFLAVAGVLLGKEICRIYGSKYRLAETMRISLSLQMLTLPFTAWYYFEIPVYSMLLNLVVLPLMGVVLLLGLAGGVLGLLFSGGMFVRLPLAGCTLLLGWFSGAGKLFLHLPGAVYLTGQPQIWQLAGYYLILAGSVFLAMRRAQTRTENRTCKEGAKTADSRKVEKGGGRSRRMVETGFLLCLLFILLPVPKPAEVSVLDVGQGDGIYIRTSDGMHLMIDGGSTDIRQAGTRRILPFLKSQKVAAIDYWFLSHLDQDHISGFLEIVQSGYPVREVVLASGVVKDAAYEKIIGQLSGYRINIRYLKKGETLSGIRSRVRCLAPASGHWPDGRNANSLVLLYEDGGFSGLFSGDISKKEEQKMLSEQRMSPVSLYKAAHHGSDHSNARELLAVLKPSVCVVSCARENSYGHPGKEAVSAMQTYSGSIRYTMCSGQIRVTYGRSRLKVTVRQ